MLLVQLQEQGEEDGTATASATENGANSADPQDSSPASSSTKPIKVITSSLAEGQVQVKKLQLQRHAAHRQLPLVQHAYFLPHAGEDDAGRQLLPN